MSALDICGAIAATVWFLGMVGAIIAARPDLGEERLWGALGLLLLSLIPLCWASYCIARLLGAHAQ